MTLKNATTRDLGGPTVIESPGNRASYEHNPHHVIIPAHGYGKLRSGWSDVMAMMFGNKDPGLLDCYGLKMQAHPDIVQRRAGGGAFRSP